MTAFSIELSDALVDLSIKQVQCLLRTLSELTMRQRQFVEAHYSEQAANFDATLEFLRNISWVLEEEHGLSLTEQGEAASRTVENLLVTRTKLTDAIISSQSPYRVALAKYFKQFKSSNGVLLHRPTFVDRLRESTTRNFLMDLGVVTYRSTDDTYLLERDGVELYIWATVQSSTSRQKFLADSEKRAELGFRAELAVVEYERSRLGAEWASKVEHVSAAKPFACYDIKSVSVQDGGAVDRFIEVKAEPDGSHRFYWPASEVELARILRANYFLYLLPTAGVNEFDVGRLLIIQEPIASVYDNREHWEIEENVILCKQR